MSARPQPCLPPEQYLELDRAAEIRSEFYDGRMYAMSSGTHPHALVIANLARELGNALKHGPCLVTSSDLRVCISPNGLYTYPDIVVVPDKPSYLPGHKDTLLNPTLIVEVLSPSTEAYDRGFKASQFRKLESLQEYVLVSQSKPWVEIFRRQTGGEWLFSESMGIESSCRFDSVGAEVALTEIYSKVTLDQPEPSALPG